MKVSQNALVGIITISVTAVTVITMATLHHIVPEPKQGVVPRFNEDGTAYVSSSSRPVDVHSSLASSVKEECPDADDRQTCLDKTVLAIVDSYGPAESIGALNILLAEKTMHGRGDYHDYVHRIGRLTAKKMGLNPDGFFLCPVDYNYGCQHGFFEQALVEEPDAVKAAEIVCDETRMDGKPVKFLFYCYHGVGHGVMMAKAYDLDASLAVCDQFSKDSQKAGCQQGVFMEAVVGYMNGTAKREGVFSETDRLAPCNRLEPRFQYQCYINMGGYLAAAAGTGKGAVERATEPCLKADAAHIHTCLASVGLTATNSGWQPVLTPEYEEDQTAKNGASICAHFPKGYEVDCIGSGVENLAQFDRGDTTRMVDFCLAVDDAFRSACFQRIGRSVKDEMPGGTPPESLCAGVPEEYRIFCISGAKM